MILTPAQIQQLIKIIENQHLIFLSNTVGTGILTQHDLDTLARFGIDISSLPKYGVVDEAFKFGILADALGSKEAKKLSYEEFRIKFQSGGFIPLTEAEKLTLDHVKMRMYGDVTGLGARIGNDIKNIVLENSKKQRSKYEEILRETIASGVKDNKTAREIASDLGHKTQDWAKDFDRIADYVLHEAFDTGKAISMINKAKKEGEVAYCYKEVYPGACPNCIRLYLTNGYGSKPQIFKVSTLMANGTNIGRKTADWKPVIGSVHPWCRCEMFSLPANMAWDEEKKMFVLIRNDYGIKRKSKIKITSE